MPEKIKALILEDVMDDAELLVLEIRRQGFDVDWKTTDNEKEMREILQAEHFDIVFSDYVMPDFSGLDALKVVREFDNDMPFIIISGTVGDELAVEAMVAGAHDYIMKDNMVRLGATITRELKEADIRRTLRERENQLNSIFDASPIAIGTLLNRTFTFVNEKLLELFGYTEEELIGRNVRILYDTEEEYNKVGVDYYKQLEESGRASLETLLVTKDGRKLNVNINSTFIEKENEDKGITFTIEDITQKKRDELSKEIYYNISVAINTSDDLKELSFKIKDELAKKVDVSNYYIALYDSEKDVLELPLHIDEKDKIHSAPAAGTLTKYVIERGQPTLLTDEDIEKLLNDGVVKRVASPSVCWLGIPLKVKGNTVGLLGLQSYSNRNAYSEEDLEFLGMVSEQIATAVSLKIAQDDLIHNEERYRFLANATSEAIFISKNGFCTDSNSRASELFGYSYEEFNGMFATDIIADNFKEIVKNNILSGHLNPYEAEGLHKDGSTFPVLILGRNFDMKGENFRLTTMYDLTLQKKNEQELILAKEKAEESDRLKSAFLANMSHEIRTPMNAILGFSSLLDDDALPSMERKEYLNIINTNANTLLRLIEDIIDISKIEAGTLVIRNKKCELSRMMRDAVQTIKQKVENNQKDIDVRLELDESKALNVFIDVERLMQILVNLLSNAEKFTSVGTIETGFHLVEPERSILFYVRDTGIGIPEEMLEYIFERFRQVDDSNTRRYGGAGLGLTITKKLVELMGGKIWVKSRPDFGSTFYFKLPYIPAERQVEKELIYIEEQDINWNDRNILIVEDVESNYIYIKAIISRTGAETVWVEDGKSAVDEAQRNKYDVVLMDLQLPILDGYSATKEIRTFNKEVPVIALTAYAREEDRLKALENGCTDYLSKPVSKKELLSKIGQYLEK